jgi:outer membrane autotransporter protein
MNLSYRLVWSAVRKAWIVVSELAKSHTKSGVVLLATAALSAPAQAAGPISADGAGTVTNVASDTYTGANTQVGVRAEDGGSIVFDEAGQFVIETTDSAALKANRYGSIAEAGNGGGTYTITTTAGPYAAIEASGNSSIDLSTAYLIDLTTQQKNAVYAGGGSSIEMSHLVINQNYAGADGVAILAYGQSTVTVARLELTSNQVALQASGEGSVITIGAVGQGTSRIDVSGDNHAAVIVEDNASVSLTETAIVTSGNNSNGVEVSDGATLGYEGGSITTSGDNSHGLVYDLDAAPADTTLQLNRLNINASSSTSDAIVINSSLTQTTQPSIDLFNPFIHAGRNAIALESGAAVINMTGGLVQAENAALYAATDTTLTVNTSDTNIKGDVVAESGAVLDLSMTGLNGKSRLTGAVVNANQVQMNNSVWNITGDSSADTINNTNSILSFSNADGTKPDSNYTDFKSVTVHTYTSSGSSTVYMNTRLNGDDVTGQTSDKIVVTDGGSMSGDTQFVFNNAGGAGATTTDGILFVEAQGSATVDKSNMKIAGGSVTAGAFAYVGRQGQITDPSDTDSLYLTNVIPEGGSVDENGFIVMDADQTVPTVPPTEPPITEPELTLPTPTVPPVTEPPVTTPPDSTAPEGNLSYSPDFVTYNAVSDVVSLSANTLLGTYHERMGAQNTPLMQKNTSKSNSWVRLIADNRDVAYNNAAFNQSIEGSTTGIQVGQTLSQTRHANGSLTQFGLAAGYVQGSMDVFGDFITTKNGHAGTVDAKTTSVSGYYTLSNDNGTYLDAVVQYSYSDSNAQGQQSEVDLKSTGLRGSLEMGVPVRLDRVILEPQAQVVTYKDTFDSAVDSGGYEMSQGDNSGVIFRVGARLTPSDTSSNFKPWFAANVNKQNASTASGVMDNTNNVGLNSEKDSAWADVSVGMSFETEGGATVYGHLKQSAAIDGGKNTVTSGAIGIQKAW